MKCCQCDSEKIVQGRVFNQLDYIAPAAYFRPNGLRPFTLFDINIRIRNIFHSCMDCGFMWAEIDPAKLKKVITEKGTEIVKSKLGDKE